MQALHGLSAAATTLTALYFLRMFLSHSSHCQALIGWSAGHAECRTAAECRLAGQPRGRWGLGCAAGCCMLRLTIVAADAWMPTSFFPLQHVMLRPPHCLPGPQGCTRLVRHVWATRVGRRRTSGWAWRPSRCGALW